MANVLVDICELLNMNKVMDTIFAWSAAQWLSQVFIILAVTELRYAVLECFVKLHAVWLL
jgi:hypothetical protein